MRLPLLPTLFVIVISAVTSAVTGCAFDKPSAGAAYPASSSAALAGRVFGGQQPISGAAISLYAAGSTGPGKGAADLLTRTILTDANGSFNITANDYTCPSSAAQTYVVARGGNPGLAAAGATNAASVLMVALGDCDGLSSLTLVNINEVTTAGAAWALQQFLDSGAVVGASSTNATGLRNAFLVANNLVNVATGLAGASALPAGAYLESAKLYTLADALSSCVNSDGTTACAPLFSASAVNGLEPANTLDAALNIVLHPASGVATVFDAAPANGPFQPVLASTPNDWTISITYTGGGLNHPTALAVDSTGSVWAANYFGSAATKLSVTGQPAAASGFADASLEESYGITVDGTDSAWITNEESSHSINTGDGSITKFSSSGQLLSGTGFTTGGIYYPQAIAADSDGTIWVADYGRSRATLLSPSGASLSGVSGFTSTSLPFPSAVALDGLHEAWFAAEGSAVRIDTSGAATAYSCCNAPSGLAVDQAGNIWVSDYPASALIELSNAGLIVQRIIGQGGIYYPNAVAADGNGNVWVTNFHGGSISGFTGAASGSSSTPLSPVMGFGVDATLAEPYGLAIDASGNVWVSNSAGNTLTQFVGLASPIRTPLLGPPAQP